MTLNPNDIVYWDDPEGGLPGNYRVISVLREDDPWAEISYHGTAKRIPVEELEVERVEIKFAGHILCVRHQDLRSLLTTASNASYDKQTAIMTKPLPETLIEWFPFLDDEVSKVEEEIADRIENLKYWDTIYKLSHQIEEAIKP